MNASELVSEGVCVKAREIDIFEDKWIDRERERERERTRSHASGYYQFFLKAVEAPIFGLRSGAASKGGAGAWFCGFIL